MVVFSDYRLVGKFVDTCSADISSLGCGRVELGDSDSYLTQVNKYTLQ
jgi:hypothetical protein